ncbi:similar to U6 snRNA-associated Sm-like protein LSm8 isoform 2 [Ectocarpus siliculosus]|uniref:U6 snRNA-associated Sm-like protein LSm8 n=1 Tax=Ectocarpus siliculosus TaxID=2880 RepID=D7FKG9_ECTSI|nr:similar to U6 snRNA-associated Sm-like protein LSm8 isoform 2 [Ectocarpus siliculosus]|eukprot:CBJ29371.1 similar to U6 snRNA-associated Sm-like protein LSm8 isoform 2 [Ectocarpus siliculosus]
MLLVRTHRGCLLPLREGLLKRFAPISRHVLVFYQGNLKGYDHTINLVLEGCKERIYSQSRGVEQARETGTYSSMVVQVQLGLYICRGDNIAVIGEVDEVEDASKDLSRIRAEPLKPVTH